MITELAEDFKRNIYWFDMYTEYMHHCYLDGDIYSVLIMSKDGGSFARVYVFKDEPNFITLDWLSVEDGRRKLGIGTELQIMREDFASFCGAKSTILWVDNDTWQMEWYKRRGYSFYKKKDDKHSWLKKDLK